MKRGRRPLRNSEVQPTDRHRNVARRVIREEQPFLHAMVAEGYSENMGRKGMTQAMKRIPALRKAIHDEVKKYVRGHRSEITAEEQEEFVRFGLLKNAIAGQDSGVRSLELLGKDKRVNMFQPEVAVGIFQNSVPADWKQKFSLSSEPIPTIEADADEPEKKDAE